MIAMGNTKKLKSGKFQFKKKDGTWSKTHFETAKAANAAKRATRSGGGGKAAPSAPSNNKWGWGRWARSARTIDIVSGPAVGSITRYGATRGGGLSLANRYTARVWPDGRFDMETAKGTYGGIGTGLGRDFFRSKLGIYRGMGQKKFLSAVMVSNPELMAGIQVTPWENPSVFNRLRMNFDRGYNPMNNTWDLTPGSVKGSRFWRSISLDLILRGVQHIFFDTTGPIGLNKMLGKGVNA